MDVLDVPLILSGYVYIVLDIDLHCPAFYRSVLMLLYILCLLTRAMISVPWSMQPIVAMSLSYSTHSYGPDQASGPRVIKLHW